MGIELDVLTGHPDHDLLFVATQVARAAGLKNPSHAVSMFRKANRCPINLTIRDLSDSDRERGGSFGKGGIFGGGTSYGRGLPAHTGLMDEPTIYKMLLRGHAPASEPFRKWVTEEVLPTIRKTGKYNAEESTNPIAQGVMDELKTLRGEVGELKSLLEILMARPLLVAESAPAESVSTYLCPEVHTEFVWRHFNRSLLIKLCDLKNLSVPVADKLKPAVMVKLEVALLDLWNSMDARMFYPVCSACELCRPIHIDPHYKAMTPRQVTREENL